MRLRLCLLILGGLFFSATAQEYAAGDQWSLFFWKRESGQTNNQGYYCGSTIENIYTQNNRTTIRGNARVDMPGWAELVLGNKAESQLRINLSKPASVISCSPVFETVKWIEQLTITTGDTTQSCRFEFPMLSSATACDRNDYIKIAVNDTIELQYTVVEQDLFVGHFINTAQKGDPEKWLMGRNAFIVLTSDVHPLRIHSLEIKGAYREIAETYLGIDLSRFDDDAEAYGLDFIDTTITFTDTTVSDTIRTIPPTFEGLEIEGELPLKADSTYTIKLDASEIEQAFSHCTLFVIYGQDTTRQVLMNTASPTGEFQWYVPSRSDTANLRLSVFDTTSAMISECSRTVPIQRDITGVHNAGAVPGQMSLQSLQYASGSFSMNIAAPRNDIYDLSIRVYNTQGRLVFNDNRRSLLSAGYHSFSMPTDLSTGTYVAKMTLETGANRKKVTKSRVMTVIP